MLRRLQARLALALGALSVVAGCAHAQPGGVCAENFTSTSDHDLRFVNLTWDPTPGATSYHVTRVLDGGPAEEVAVLPATQTTYNETGPEGVVEYRVGVDGTPSEACFPQSFHFGGEPPPPPEPTCVAGLVALPLGDGSIQLTWTPVPTPGVFYDVFRGEGGATPTPFAIVGDGSAQFHDTTTVAGTTYAYSVAANGLPAEPCPVVEATAIPDFPGVVPWVAAAAVAGAAMVLAGRKR
jgi:hypothetical protein